MFTSLLFASYWFFGFYSVSPSSFFPILILSWFKQRPKCHRALHFSCVSFTLHAHTAAHIHYFCLLMDVVDAVVSTGAKNCTHLCCHGVLFKPQCTQRKGFFSSSPLSCLWWLWTSKMTPNIARRKVNLPRLFHNIALFFFFPLQIYPEIDFASCLKMLPPFRFLKRCSCITTHCVRFRKQFEGFIHYRF